MKRKLSPAQRAWCKLYEDKTGFDVHTMSGYLTGDYESFHEAAMLACRWYEDHASDAYLAITQKVPGEWKAFNERIANEA